MQPPTVRTLDELIAGSNAVYDPQRNAYRDQIAQSGSRLATAEQGLNAAKDNAFQGITQTAVNRNMLFSGFTPDQQAKYTAEKYLPALAGLRTANEANIGKLNTAIMGLDAEQRKGAMDTQNQDLSKLYDYQREQDRRNWEAQQAKIAYDRELAKMRQSAALSRQGSGGSGLTLARNSKGGYTVLNNGSSANMDLATYAKLTGTNLINLLANGDAKDRQAAKWFNDNLRLGRGENYAWDRLMNYDRPTAFYAGGGRS